MIIFDNTAHNQLIQPLLIDSDPFTCDFFIPVAQGYHINTWQQVLGRQGDIPKLGGFIINLYLCLFGSV